MAGRRAGVLQIVLAVALHVGDRGDAEGTDGEFHLQIGAEQGAVGIGGAAGLRQEGIAPPLRVQRGVLIAAEVRARRGVGALAVGVGHRALPGIHARRMLVRIAGEADIEGHVHLVRRLPGEDAAQGPVVDGPTAGDAGVEVLDVAVGLFLHPRQARLQPVGDRAGDRTLDVEVLIAARAHGQVRLEVPGGLVGDELDGAAGGVAAEQGALRPAQHLDPLQVEQGEARRDEGAGIAVVLIDGHRRLLLVAEVVLRHAADVEDHGGRGVLVHLQAGHVPHQIGGVLDALAGQLGGAHHGHGNAHVLQALFPPLGGDHHLLHLIRRRGCGRSVCRRRHGGHDAEAGKGGAGQQRGAKRGRRWVNPSHGPDPRSGAHAKCFSLILKKCTSDRESVT